MQIGPPIYFKLVKHGARLLLALAGTAALLFVLSACDLGGVHPIFPDPVSPNGQGIYNTYIGISLLAIIVFVGVEAALLWVVIRYRRSAQPAGYVPPQVHGHTGLEIAWTIAPLVIVLAIAVYSFAELQKDFQPISNQQMTVIQAPVPGHRRDSLVVGACRLGQDRRRARIRQLLLAEDRPDGSVARRVRGALRGGPRLDADHRPGYGSVRIRCMDDETEGGGFTFRFSVALKVG